MLLTMFDALGRAVARRPWTAIGIWAALTGGCVALALVGVGGQTLFERLTTGALEVPGSESAEAQEIIDASSETGESLTLAVRGVDPRQRDLSALLDQPRADLAAIPGVLAVIDPFVLPEGPASPAAAPLIAADGNGFLVVVVLAPRLDDQAQQAALDRVESGLRAILAVLSGAGTEVTGQVGGTSLIIAEISDQVEQDLVTGERIALPIALLVMVLVFGGFLAAALPMVGALASIAGGLGSVYGLSYVLVMEFSVVNVVTVLGLGLSIDYGLLIVSRFREELRALLDVDDGAAVRQRRGDGAVEAALRATMQTAGRTVAFSAVTIAVAVCGLMVFAPHVLRAFGSASAAVVLIAVATALTLVPALLALTGRRLVRPGIIGKVPGLRAVLARTGDAATGEGAFSRLAERVQRHPWRVVGATLVILGVLAAPAMSIQLRNSTIELLPTDSDQRGYVEEISRQYPASVAAPIVLLAEGSLEEVADWSARLVRFPEVAAVDPPSPVGPYVVVGVRPDTDDPGGVVAGEAVLALRDAPAPFPVWVTGQAANQVDFVDSLVDRSGWAIGIVAGGTLVLLFLMTGSLVIPIKALLTNAVSMSATLGVLVWGFQFGHLSGLLGFVPVGGIETYVVALVVAFAFGLAMDYEVFLLSRIKEVYDAGRGNDEAVRLGLQRSGRIITSAAAIIVVVFAGFVFGDLLIIKEVGFSLAIAVAIDATIVRMLLVPATMTLLGRFNWWAPRPLRRLHERFGLAH